MEKNKKKSQYEEEANVAAGWWRDNMGPQAKQDNGVAMHSIMMSMLSGRMKIDEKQKEAFFNALKKVIIETLEDRGRMSLHVDYDPDYILSQAARESGVQPMMGLFPCKTSMWIEKGLVSVSCGYGADSKEIYNAKDESQPGNN